MQTFEQFGFTLYPDMFCKEEEYGRTKNCIEKVGHTMEKSERYGHIVCPVEYEEGKLTKALVAVKYPEQNNVNGYLQTKDTTRVFLFDRKNNELRTEMLLGSPYISDKIINKAEDRVEYLQKNGTISLTYLNELVKDFVERANTRDLKKEIDKNFSVFDER